MLKHFVMSTCVGVLLTVPAMASAQAQNSVINQITLRGTVQAVDHVGRTMTLRGEQGNIVTVDVPTTVTRFEQVKVGDTITATYADRVDVRPHAEGSPEVDRVVDATTTAAGDAPPSASAIRQRETTVTITSWNPATGVVTFTTPTGVGYTRRVAESIDPTVLAGLKVGQQADITRTEASSVTLQFGLAPPAPAVPSTERRVAGTITAVGRGSFVLWGDDGNFAVYSMDRNTVGVPTLTNGTRVRVTTAANDNDDAPLALAIDALPPREGLAPQAGDDNIPVSVRQLSAQIERQAKKFRVGAAFGAALDPELISLDAFTTFSPGRSARFAFRPGIELAFGEVTTLFGIHVDALFGFPGIRPTTRWAPYFGVGPSFSFSHRGVDEEEFITGDLPPGTTPTQEEEDRFDFSQFDWDNGFNFIVGARTPRGAFIELKATAYGVASIRMLGGFEF